jgi:hypothetical protein
MAPPDQRRWRSSIRFCPVGSIRYHIPPSPFWRTLSLLLAILGHHC